MSIMHTVRFRHYEITFYVFIDIQNIRDINDRNPTGKMAKQLSLPQAA